MFINVYRDWSLTILKRTANNCKLINELIFFSYYLNEVLNKHEARAHLLPVEERWTLPKKLSGIDITRSRAHVNSSIETLRVDIILFLSFLFSLFLITESMEWHCYGKSEH